MTDKFMENIAERYDKLSKQARNEFWLGYNQNNLDIKNADVYDLLKDVLEWEKIKKEEIKMIDEKKVGIDEAKKGSEETKIQVVDRKKQALLIKQEVSIAEMKEQATILFQSGYFTDVQSVAQAYVKIKAGQELGFPAFFSLQNFFILPGKPPASSGQVMGALAKRSGFDYRILEHSNTICTVKIFGLRGEELGVSTFTYQEASRIVMKTKYGEKRLIDKDNWKNYPKMMLFWRALVQGLRMHCPDAIAGLYLQDEVMNENVAIGEDSDLSNFKVEETSKKDTIDSTTTVNEATPEKTRKEILAPLAEKHGMKRVKEVIAKCKIEGSVYDTTDEKFKEVIDTLNILGKVIDKFKKGESKEDNKKTEITIEEKRKELKKLKKDFGEDRIVEVKKEMKIEGKLIEIDEKTFKKFVKKVKIK